MNNKPAIILIISIILLIAGATGVELTSDTLDQWNSKTTADDKLTFLKEHPELATNQDLQEEISKSITDKEGIQITLASENVVYDSKDGTLKNTKTGEVVNIEKIKEMGAEKIDVDSEGNIKITKAETEITVKSSELDNPQEKDITTSLSNLLKDSNGKIEVNGNILTVEGSIKTQISGIETTFSSLEGKKGTLDISSISSGKIIAENMKLQGIDGTKITINDKTAVYINSDLKKEGEYLAIATKDQKTLLEINSKKTIVEQTSENLDSIKFGKSALGSQYINGKRIYEYKENGLKPLANSMGKAEYTGTNIITPQATGNILEDGRINWASLSRPDEKPIQLGETIKHGKVGIYAAETNNYQIGDNSNPTYLSETKFYSDRQTKYGLFDKEPAGDLYGKKLHEFENLPGVNPTDVEKYRSWLNTQLKNAFSTPGWTLTTQANPITGIQVQLKNEKGEVQGETLTLSPETARAYIQNKIKPLTGPDKTQQKTSAQASNTKKKMGR